MALSFILFAVAKKGPDTFYFEKMYPAPFLVPLNAYADKLGDAQASQYRLPHRRQLHLLEYHQHLIDFFYLAQTLEYPRHVLIKIGCRSPLN